MRHAADVRLLLTSLVCFWTLHILVHSSVALRYGSVQLFTVCVFISDKVMS